MGRIQKNISANILALGWAAVLQVLFVPLFIKLIGIEAYGLVGLYLVLQACSRVFDFGLGTSLNREVARASVRPEDAGEIRDILFTLQALSCGVGLVAGTAVALAAPLIAGRWIPASSLPPADVAAALRLMGVLLALQWPLALYQDGLMGLQRQALSSGIRAACSTLGTGGALLILWQFHRTVQAYFAWQAVVAFLQAAALGFSLWRLLPRSGRPARARLASLGRIGGFAAGVSGIAITALVLTQLDKVILSKMLPLETFGYYTLATTVAGGLVILVQPVYNTFFPLFSALAARSDGAELRRQYHRGSQLMAVLVLPAAAALSLFTFEAILLWTGSPVTARNACSPTRLLVIGTALNGLLYLPYALQLSHGFTRLPLLLSLAMILLFVPALVVLARLYGPAGAAAAWAGLNVLVMVSSAPLTHCWILRGETLRWYRDVGAPLLGALAPAVLARLLLKDLTSPLGILLALAAVGSASTVAALLAAPLIRRWAFSRLTRRGSELEEAAGGGGDGAR